MLIKGSEIINFPCGINKIERVRCNFEVKSDEHTFDFISDLDLDYIFNLVCENKSEHVNYLYCLDEEGKFFTLYDCYISPLQLPITKVRILWDRCIQGFHFSCINGKNICSAEYIIDGNKNLPFQMFVGKNDFAVLNQKAQIITDWSLCDNKIEGVSVIIKSTQPESIDNIEIIFLRLLELYFLQFGFFPNVKQCKMKKVNGEEFFYEKQRAAYSKTARANISMKYVLYEAKDCDYSSAYNNWWEMREKEVTTFNLFAYMNCHTDDVSEVPIATYMQCLEGYFSKHHNSEMKKFSDNAKKDINAVILECLNNSSELKVACEKHDIQVDKIISSIQGLTGHINQKSNREMLEYAIERSDMTKKLFFYEKSENIVNESSDKKYLVLNVFISKALGHRNWLSHLQEQSMYFRNEETELATDKLKLLFRLSLLYDIGFTVTESSLDSVIAEINDWYRKYKLKI